MQSQVTATRSESRFTRLPAALTPFARNDELSIEHSLPTEAGKPGPDRGGKECWQQAYSLYAEDRHDAANEEPPARTPY